MNDQVYDSKSLLYQNATFTVKFHVEWRRICPTAEEEYGDEEWELDRVRHERQQGIVPDHVGSHQHRPESQFVNIQEKQRGTKFGNNLLTGVNFTNILAKEFCRKCAYKMLVKLTIG